MIRIIGLIIGLVMMISLIPLIKAIFIYDEVGRTNYNCKQLKDPTYSEMKEFLARDQTNLNEYRNSIFDYFILKRYICTNFARDVKKNAISQGIRCAGVKIWFEKDFDKHAIVAFRTTDRGVIFIEPYTDEIKEVIIGQDYCGMGIVANIKIYWPRIKNN